MRWKSISAAAKIGRQEPHYSLGHGARLHVNRSLTKSKCVCFVWCKKLSVLWYVLELYQLYSRRSICSKLPEVSPCWPTSAWGYFTFDMTGLSAHMDEDVDVVCRERERFTESVYYSPEGLASGEYRVRCVCESTHTHTDESTYPQSALRPIYIFSA